MSTLSKEKSNTNQDEDEDSSEKAPSNKQDEESENLFIPDKVKKIFKLFDMDKDELINMDEMRVIFRQMG